MEYTKHYENMKTVCRCGGHRAAPIPQEGVFSSVENVSQLCGFSHGVGTCAMKQGACKLSLNIKDGVVQEALVEVLGCTGMTQSAAMAAEILPGKTLMEALNTDLVCDAINVAMREFFLNMVYGRSQTAFSKDGLAVGSAFEDLGTYLRSQLGTHYGTAEKGPRYLELTEGYVTRMGLDKQDRVIGYEFVNLGKMMSLIQDGTDACAALKAATGTYGRFSEAVRTINPRKE